MSDSLPPSTNVIQFPGNGQPLSFGDRFEHEIDLEVIYEGAKNSITHNLIVIGQEEDDSIYFASSSKDIAKLIVLVELFKKMLLDAV